MTRRGGGEPIEMGAQLDEMFKHAARRRLIRRRHNLPPGAPPPYDFPQRQRGEWRSKDFWWAVFAEFAATFFYVFVTSGATVASGQMASDKSVPTIANALAAGAIATVIYSVFYQFSGAHFNPAVTYAIMSTERITPLRGILYSLAQTAGGMLGALFIAGSLPDAVVDRRNQTAMLVNDAFSTPNPDFVTVIDNVTKCECHKMFLIHSGTDLFRLYGMELVATFLVPLVFMSSSTPTIRKPSPFAPLFIGLVYMACSLSAVPVLNPARALGVSVVTGKWEPLMVHLIGPICGGLLSGGAARFIFNPKRRLQQNQQGDADSSSYNSDEESDDEGDMPQPDNLQVSTISSLRLSESCRLLSLNQAGKSNATSPAGAGQNHCSKRTETSVLPCEPEREEMFYGGAPSSKSPRPARSCLNRSQSFYSKVPSDHRDHDGLPHPGPLVPAQSLYPMRFHINPTSATQNIQNLQNQHSESIYGIRGVSNTVNRGQTGGVYGVSHGSTAGRGNTGSMVSFETGPGSSFTSSKPEPIYGIPSRWHEAEDLSNRPCNADSVKNNIGMRNFDSGFKYSGGSKLMSSKKTEIFNSSNGHNSLLSPTSPVSSSVQRTTSFRNTRSPSTEY